MGSKISRELNRNDNNNEFNDDYDHKIARKLIRTGRLAPMYKGLSDPPSRDTEDTQRTVDDSTIYKKPRLPWELPQRQSAPAVLRSEKIIECPICLLYYPTHINYSRCCSQPICTECFLQLKRSSKTPLQPVSCPFCVRSEFGVVYIPPATSNHYKELRKRRKDSLLKKSGRLKSLTWDDPDVVLVDQVRPNWHMLVSCSGADTRSLSGSGSTRRRLVRPNGDNQRGTVRAWDSAYYERAGIPDWTADDSAVLDAIRGGSSSLHHNTRPPICI
ncbi:hypothetical protein BJV82DRAFT_669120 [Fennellomyces sp. T-0311]|nr:hypothetical protein BJV82DRAFT_669120 [Fennellomyces sp. T-0311]